MLTAPRIKICGITRREDAAAAVRLGADALGLVFYEKSPRYLSPEAARALLPEIPPFVTLVGLFVNPDPAEVEHALATLPIDLLQFHGDEDEAACQRYGRPYLKAARMKPGLDLLQYAAGFASARALLLDAHVAGYGGGGKTFDWSLIPEQLPLPLVLSGGLSADNISAAIRQVRPVAVDVSSGVETAPGIKDHAKIAAFIAGVRNAQV